MVDLPLPNYPVSTSRAPQSGVSPSQIAQPYQELAHSLDKVGEGLEAVSVNAAEQAGYQSVTRDANGDIQVQKLPLIGPAATAYGRAVKMAALAEGEGDAKRADLALRQQYRDNPDGYAAAAEAFKAETVKKYTDAAGPEVGIAMGRAIEGVTTQTYRGLLNEKERLELARADSAITSGIQSARDDAVALARQGVTEGPAWDAVTSKFNALTNERMNNPRLSYPKETADYDRQHFAGELAANGFLHHIDQVYQQAPSRAEGASTAMEAAKSILTDPAIKLTPSEREAYYHKAIGEVRANEAIRRQDVQEANLAFRELTTASTLGLRIEPEQVEQVRQAYRAAGNPAGVAAVDAAFSHKDLHDDFGRQPLSEQTRQLNEIRTRGVNPGLQSVMQRAQQISGVPFAIGFEGGTRDQATQDRLVGEGRSQTRNSKHLYGMALDLLPIENGKANPDAKPETFAEINRAMRQASQELGIPIEWGGDWREFKDYAHFQLAGPAPSNRTASASPAAASWLLANRSRTLDTAAATQWSQVVKDWDAGKGGRPSDQQVYDVLNAARTTNNIDLQATVQRDMTIIDAVQQAGQMPLAAQQAMTTELRRQLAAGEGSPGTQLVEKQLAARAQAVTTGLQSDPIATTVTNFPSRFKTPDPLNLQDDNALMAGLQQRARIAQFAAQNWQSGPVSALDRSDLATVQAALATPDPAVKSRIFSALTLALPEDVRNATLARLAGNDPDRMAQAAAGSLMSEAPDVAQSIFRGQQAMKVEKRLNPEEADKNAYLEDVSKALPYSTFTLAARTDPTGPYATTVNMVKARYADLAAQAGQTDYSKDRLRQAVTDVTGGVLAHNGGTLIAPQRGMPQGTFDRVLWGVGDNDLAGVTTLGGQAVTPDYLRGTAQLESVGDGRYFVRLGADPLKPIYAYRYAGTEAPTKFVLDLRGRSPPAAMTGALDFAGTP